MGIVDPLKMCGDEVTDRDIIQAMVGDTSETIGICNPAFEDFLTVLQSPTCSYNVTWKTQIRHEGTYS
jgi:hypothetical protein